MSDVSTDRPKALKKLSTGVVVVLALVIGQPFLWMYVLSSAQHLNSVRTSDAQYVILQGRLEDIQKTSAEQQSLLEQLSVVFPDSHSVPQLVARLEQIGDEHGVVVDVQQIGEKERDAGGNVGAHVERLSITVQAFGSVDVLLAYIDAIEHIQEMTSVDSWTIEPRQMSGDEIGVPQGAVQFALTARVIFYVQKEDG